MGLAACQARLLTLTMRRTDDQYKLMKLANDQLKLACESEDIEEEFDLAKNAALYTYQYDANDTKSTENLTYSGLMGSNSLHSGRNPIYLTNTDDQVILDSAYGAAMSAANMAGGGTAKDNAKCFNAFAAAMTGDNSFSWYAALKTGKNIPTADIEAKAKSVITPVYSGSSDKYSSYAEDFKCRFGNPEFDYNRNSSGEPNKLADALMLYDFVDRNYGFSTQVYNLVSSGGDYRNNPKKTYDGTRYIDLSADEKQQLEQYEKLLAAAKSNDSEVYYNNDYYTEETYNKLLTQYANENSLNAADFRQCVYTGSCGDNENAVVTSYSIPTLRKYNMSTYDSAYTYAFNYYSENPDKLGGNYGQVSSDIKSAAEYYHNIFAKCIGTTNGKPKYKVDDQITDNAYLYAKLENNVYQVNGQTARENKNCTLKTVRDDEFQYEKAKDNYNRALNDVKKKEKQIETKKTAVQADLSACETEMQSVQSLIDKNIERSFTYCQA